MQFFASNSYDTGKNFPGRGEAPPQEEKFQLEFEKIWLAQFPETARFTREFDLSGHGRADLVVVNDTEIIAVEIKLSDWRKGLMQANTYRYYANQAILLMPSPVTRQAIKVIETFNSLGISLWGFDPVTKKIVCHNQPPPKNPLNFKSRQRAELKLEVSPNPT